MENLLWESETENSAHVNTVRGRCLQTETEYRRRALVYDKLFLRPRCPDDKLPALKADQRAANDTPVHPLIPLLCLWSSADTLTSLLCAQDRKETGPPASNYKINSVVDCFLHVYL